METNSVLAEAKRLHDMGLAIHWLHPKSKRPVESGWTTGPRKPWRYLKETYRAGMNVGVRLGTPSKIEENFLGVIDVDVKSIEPKHAKEVRAKLAALTGSHTLPEVKSGRGNGSRHLYILTPAPMPPAKIFQSTDVVKVHMPSSTKPSKKDLLGLSQDELDRGLRLRPAWEIAVMGEGQQVVLPPSIHPDSGKRYVWQADFTPALALGFDDSRLKSAATNVEKSVDIVEKEKPGPKTLDDFEVTPVELSWLPLHPKIKAMIETGEGVEDRSAMLLPISKALLQAGLSRNEILTVLTDTANYMGPCAFEHAKTSNREKAARWVWKFTLAKVMLENSGRAMFDQPLVEDVKELSNEERAADQALFNEEIYSWQIHLDHTRDDKVRGTLRNVVMILENEIGEDVVKRDTFCYRDFYSIDTPWGGKTDDALTDDDVVKIKLWLSNHFGCEPTSNTIGEALTILATRNAFDPVIDWLDQLPAWDEVERLDGWLKNHFHARGNEEYLAQVFRKWLVAMVIRAYRPGTKFDWMPIFEGDQGVGKSSFGRILCGEKYFLDWLPDLANKDSALALQGIWSVEMGELASFRKNEIETVKAFITRTVDKVRPPYGERWLEVRRRCVFFGTTNFDTYLRDDSGNRRFKPVKVGRLDFDVLEEERTQLFAEAKWLWKNGFETERTLEISGDARAYELSIQADKMVSDESALMLESLRHFIANEVTKDEAERFDFSRFQMSDLFRVLGGSKHQAPPLENWKYDSRNVQFAAKALKVIGGESWRSHGARYYRIRL